MIYFSSWPKELRYGIYHHCSFKLQHYGLEQLISKIPAIHKILNHNEYKYLFTNIIHLYQIASGITTQILENSAWKVDYVNSVWTAHLIKVLQKYNSQIKIENLFKIEPQRANNTSIMENELSSNDKSSLTTKQFNTCRMYFGINFSSELHSANGTELKPNLPDYVKLQTSQSGLRWPYQPKPTAKYWKAWINIIKNRYCKLRSFHLMSKNILGHWIKAHHTTYHQNRTLY